MNATDQHAPCPFCGEAALLAVAGWLRISSSDWKVVLCCRCKAEGPAAERLYGESTEDHVRRAWLYWDQRGGQS